MGSGLGLGSEGLEVQMEMESEMELELGGLDRMGEELENLSSAMQPPVPTSTPTATGRTTRASLRPEAPPLSTDTPTSTDTSARARAPDASIRRTKKQPKPKAFSLRGLEGDEFDSALGSGGQGQRGVGRTRKDIGAHGGPSSDVVPPSTSTSTVVSVPEFSTAALPVAEEEIEGWVGVLQRLVKGKVAISEEVRFGFLFSALLFS